MVQEADIKPNTNFHGERPNQLRDSRMKKASRYSTVAKRKSSKKNARTRTKEFKKEQKLANKELESKDARRNKKSENIL